MPEKKLNSPIFGSSVWKENIGDGVYLQLQLLMPTSSSRKPEKGSQFLQSCTPQPTNYFSYYLRRFLYFSTVRSSEAKKHIWLWKTVHNVYDNVSLWIANNRGVYRTLSNIYNWTFCKNTEQLNALQIILTRPKI